MRNAMTRSVVPVPTSTLGVDLAGCLNDCWNGKVHIVCVDQPDCEASVAGKCTVHCSLAKHFTVDAVIAGGGDGANDVAGVNILYVSLPLRIQQRRQARKPAHKLW